MVGHYRHASEMPFQWRLAGGPMIAHFLELHFDPLSIPSAKKKHTDKTLSVLDPLWQNFLDPRMQDNVSNEIKLYFLILSVTNKL